MHHRGQHEHDLASIRADRGHAFRRADQGAVCVRHTFGMSGCSGSVDDEGRSVRFHVRQAGHSRFERCRQLRVKAQVPAFRGGFPGDRLELGLAETHRGPGVSQDVADFGRLQPGVNRYHDQTRPEAGKEELHRLESV